jgi:phage internal scaffolding protein
MQIRKAYDKRVRKPFSVMGDSMTKQSFKRECDINVLLAKYRKTGFLDHLAKHQGQYADLPDGQSYHEAMNMILDAQESFMQLPSEVRNMFKNDPREFLDFVDDPANAEKLQDLGLAVIDSPQRESAPPTVDVETPPAGESPPETPPA